MTRASKQRDLLRLLGEFTSGPSPAVVMSVSGDELLGFAVSDREPGKFVLLESEQVKCRVRFEDGVPIVEWSLTDDETSGR